jgi:hypothetical protein
LLQLVVEPLQLRLPLLLGLATVKLVFRPLHAGIIARVRCRRLDALLVLQVLLALLLIDLEALEFLPVLRAAGWRLKATLLLEHPQLQRVLLLLPHHLVLLQ